ncbi:MAG: biotin--[acetyl-CoA-carboxylase] ligase [Clostridiaceae bacterium]|mgnify:CR=1 FL=1|nr:biotin--[acetyl-CoA-carboxylase] ligase [Clostridiaceae bacterium]
MQIEIISVDEIASTNDMARELAEQGAPAGQVVVARRQAQGRGSRGRSFASPEGGIYMSVILRPDCAMSRTPLITPAAAVAVSQTLEELIGLKTQIKWVNDILVNGQKLAGILTESRSLPGSTQIDWAVVGIGINYSNLRSDFTPDLRHIITTVRSELGPQTKLPDPEILINAIASKLQDLVSNLDVTDFIEYYRDNNVLLGREVNVLNNDNSYCALVEDIDANARLIVRRRDNGHREFLNSGEVTINPTKPAQPVQPRKGTPVSRQIYDLAVMGIFLALIIIGSKITLPFPIVPKTLQATFVLLTGAFLGWRRGGLTCLLFMLMGLAGIPVFAKGGGFGYVLDPTFGYIVGFVFGSAMTGYLCERFKARRWWSVLLSLLAGLGVLYFFGLVHLYLILGVFTEHSLSLVEILRIGLWLSLPGDLLLTGLSAILVHRLQPVFKAR